MVLRIAGMTCGSCSAAVERALSTQPGVSSANVNLIAGKAEVSWSPSTLAQMLVCSCSAVCSHLHRLVYCFLAVKAWWHERRCATTQTSQDLDTFLQQWRMRALMRSS